MAFSFGVTATCETLVLFEFGRHLVGFKLIEEPLNMIFTWTIYILQQNEGDIGKKKNSLSKLDTCYCN